MESRYICGDGVRLRKEGWSGGAVLELMYYGDEICEVLRFCDQFLQRLEIDEDFSVKQTLLDDKALLLPISIQSVYDCLI